MVQFNKDGRNWFLYKALESPLVTGEGRRSKDDRPQTVAVMSGHKRKVGEGKLFWLTAYLQLGNYFLNTLNLSNIYKYAI